MATEMAEVSNRVNFGSWVGRLTCPEKSGQRKYPMISRLVRKKRYGIQCPENIGPASTWCPLPAAVGFAPGLAAGPPGFLAAAPRPAAGLAAGLAGARDAPGPVGFFGGIVVTINFDLIKNLCQTFMTNCTYTVSRRPWCQQHWNALKGQHFSDWLKWGSSFGGSQHAYWPCCWLGTRDWAPRGHHGHKNTRYRVSKCRKGNAIWACSVKFEVQFWNSVRTNKIWIKNDFGQIVGRVEVIYWKPKADESFTDYNID